MNAISSSTLTYATDRGNKTIGLCIYLIQQKKMFGNEVCSLATDRMIWFFDNSSICFRRHHQHARACAPSAYVLTKNWCDNRDERRKKKTMTSDGTHAFHYIFYFCIQFDKYRTHVTRMLILYQLKTHISLINQLSRNRRHWPRLQTMHRAKRTKLK